MQNTFKILLKILFKSTLHSCTLRQWILNFSICSYGTYLNETSYSELPQIQLDTDIHKYRLCPVCTY